MKFKEAVKDTNKALAQLITHDHWELSLAFNLIKQGLKEVVKGFYFLLRWLFVLVTLPFIPLLYPIAILIRILKK